MSELGWLTRCLADVPSGEAWLAPRERAVLAGLRAPKRRADWLLGRWTAKVAVAAWLEASPDRVEIAAAPDGAPTPYVDGVPASLALSLSHRAGRGLAVVADGPGAVGCDLELVEPRSGAFLRDWLSPSEQALVSSAGDDGGRAANLLWTAKEAAAKVRRQGLRLDLRGALVELGGMDSNEGWHPVRVQLDRAAMAGWWRAEPDWVMAVVADPPSVEPRALWSAAGQGLGR